MNEKLKILVGMSGGLDSTYTAYRLREEGYTVGGAVLRMTDESDTAPAEKSAEEVGIPLYIVDARNRFRQYVMDDFVNCYAHGRTPNPCVMCNRYVKIAELCRCAREHGYDRVATGHYARILYDEVRGRYFVRRSENRKKDQSYMLWQLTQEELSMLITPLESEDKNEIRERAQSLGFSSAVAKESQDICFLPNGGYVGFVEEKLGKFPEGDFIDENGCVVGRHKGIIRYTVGQRKGLGIALGHPVFVTRIDAERNEVHLAPTGMEYGDTVTVGELNGGLLPTDAIRVGMEVTVKIRYAATPAPAVIESYDGTRLTARFSEPNRAVTPGQSAVFYGGAGGEDVLFGGFIV